VLGDAELVQAYGPRDARVRTAWNDDQLRRRELLVERCRLAIEQAERTTDGRLPHRYP
jgi:hypothetical protein